MSRPSLTNHKPIPGDSLRLVSYSVETSSPRTVRSRVTVESVGVDRWGDTIYRLSGGNHWLCESRGHFKYESHGERRSTSVRLRRDLCEVL